MTCFRLNARPHVSAFIALFLLHLPANANVIGSDDRVAADTSANELAAAIGIVMCNRVVDGRSRRSFGTGTIVGNSTTVLTAGHLFVAEAERSLPAYVFEPTTDCIFRRFDDDGTPVEVGFALAHFGARPAPAIPPNDDWAVLKTDRPLASHIRPVAFSAIDLDQLQTDERTEIRTVAYHADNRERGQGRGRGRLPLLSEGRIFAVDYAGSRRLAHTADMGRMASGAAIVLKTGAGPGVVVGVHRSGANFGDFNLAVPIVGRLESALRSVALGEVPLYRQQLAWISQAYSAAARRSPEPGGPNR